MWLSLSLSLSWSSSLSSSSLSWPWSLFLVMVVNGVVVVVCLRAENRTSKMQVFDVSHMGEFGGVGGVITFLASVSR